LAFAQRAKRLADHVTPDPSDRSGAPPTASNKYLMSVYLDFILPQKKPDLSVIWLRNPDTTEHEIEEHVERELETGEFRSLA